MAAPLIGITSYVEPASWAVWRDVPAALVPHRYVQHVQRAGGLAVVVPPLEPGAGDDQLADLLSRLDGLVLAGGVDVDPRRYDGPVHAKIQPPRPDRDALEIGLAKLSRDADVPLLGVCRGMQVMAVAAGGTLEQHLPDRLGHLEHSPAPGTFGWHPVQTQPGSLVAELLGEQVDVATYHHQGVATYPGLVPTAWSTDGVIEALEAPDARFRLGVQWHPEAGDDPRLFRALVAAASR
jgi:putative glutamine amidotransferase